MERPGLQRLLADIDAGLVDRIVVYKVDRLTRSLSDFAKLVERLDAASTGFVSVTQSFNTATSMGRLTLHMLLSFAQFEREDHVQFSAGVDSESCLYEDIATVVNHSADADTSKLRGRIIRSLRAQGFRIRVKGKG